MSKLGILPVPLWTVGWFSVSGSAMSRHLVEVPDSFAIARWPRDADADTTVLRQALEGVIRHEVGRERRAI